jgi:histidine kinase
LIKVKWRLRKIDIEEIANLPQMHDPDQMAKNSLILAMAMPAFYVNRHLFAYIILKAANGMLKNGLSMHAEINFIGLAAIIQNVFSDYDTGYRMGEMAIALNQRFDNRSIAGQVHHTFAFFIQHWKKHARHDIDVYRKAYQISLDAGNLIYAGHSVNAATDCRLMIGDPLDDIIEESKKYEQMMDHVKDPFITARFRENIQMARCLMGLTVDCLSLDGNDFDEAAYTNLLFREKNLFGLGFTLLYKLMLLYLHGQYERAGEAAESLDRYIDAPIGTLVVPLHHFYAGLALAAIARDKKGREKRRLLLRVKKYQRKMKQWARLCPENFAHKHDLVEAELTAVAARNKGNENAFRKSLQLYHAAIKGARQNGYNNEEAVACERLALFYLDMNAKDEAGIYIQRAHMCLGTWKAAGLQKALEGRYPDFFLPVRCRRTRPRAFKRSRIRQIARRTS